VRYTEDDVTRISASEEAITLSFSLEDKFGDNGLIAVVIMKQLDVQTLFVDTWFMSCRVLKRGMENFTLNMMVAKAKAAGYKYIIGEYLPTSKNKMVENHYPSLSFTKIEGAQTPQYVLDLEKYQPHECYIKAREL
jgi:FkbH-like protein